MAKHPSGSSHNQLPQGGGESQKSGLAPSTGDSAATKAEWAKTHPRGGGTLAQNHKDIGKK